ncbi:MAG TPA: hypothetical protein VH416_02365 [Gaiellaceae bacterium]|jgi:hypothetical protein
MRRALLLAAVAVAAALATQPLGAAVPKHGTLVPGHSLGGMRLGASPADVRARFGTDYGVCHGCPLRTWYFNYEPLMPQGVAVAFRRSRVVAVYTLWQPAGWRTAGGLLLGAPVRSLPPLPRVPCRDYRALVAHTPGAVTAYYVVGGKLWGFGLLRPGIAVCR